MVSFYFGPGLVARTVGRFPSTYHAGYKYTFYLEPYCRLHVENLSAFSVPIYRSLAPPIHASGRHALVSLNLGVADWAKEAFSPYRMP
jgi:hypothetical protein